MRLSGDVAKELRNFWQELNPDTGDVNHDFTDPNWDTRFLGDLYQDISEAARKKYALLQTPDFVEEFILDRTLEPALDEFGLTPPPILDRHGDEIASGFRMIDPACGSGHFLLGAFPRILERWQEKEPGALVTDLVQRTLKSIYGVDINPFAIAIARFRLLLAALSASGVKRLNDSPAFAMNLACGDSLYHGNKGSTVDSKGARQTTVAFENFREFTGTGLLKFPLPEGRPLAISRQLDRKAITLQATSPDAILAQRREGAKQNDGTDLCAFA